jgi:hypothetical protein
VSSDCQWREFSVTKLCNGSCTNKDFLNLPKIDHRRDKWLVSSSTDVTLHRIAAVTSWQQFPLASLGYLDHQTSV